MGLKKIKLPITKVIERMEKSAHELLDAIAEARKIEKKEGIQLEGGRFLKLYVFGNFRKAAEQKAREKFHCPECEAIFTYGELKAADMRVQNLVENFRKCTPEEQESALEEVQGFIASKK